MAPDGARSRRWLVATVGTVVLAGMLYAWLAVAALAPGLVRGAPPAAAWLVRPGSAGAMTVALGVAGAAFALLMATRWRAPLRQPFLLSAWCAGSALPLALAAYLPCTGQTPAFWDALSNTLTLFLGSFERPFGPGEACSHPVPLALPLARLLAVVATLTGATSLLLSVYRSQLDRLLMLRARRLVAVVGVDESSWPVVQRLARRSGPFLRTVLLTSDPGTMAERARAIGVLVLRTSGDDPLGLREGFRWHRTVRCYLLAADAAANRSRAMLLRRAIAALDRPPAGRLTVIARIDDPWHADDFRRRFIGDPRLVFDAIGSYEATAQSLVARIRLIDGVTHLLVVGGGPLALALLAELSQLGRELRFLDEDDVLAKVWVLDAEAEELVADHRLRQSRHAVDPLVVSAIPGEGTLAGLETALAGVAAERGSPVVVVGRADTRLGTRLAVRHPGLPVFELAAGGRPLFGDETMVGRLESFALCLPQDSGDSANAWERAARAVHERYRRRFPDAPMAVPWEDLPGEFYRESNRRQLAALLDGMVEEGHGWAPTVAETADVDEALVASPNDDVRIAEGRRVFDLSDDELTRLAAAEHQSWREHYLAGGWRYGATRDDRARRHPDLRPWAGLDATARQKTRAGVVDTLFQLRALGYRPVRADSGDGWHRYRRVGRVRASRLTEPLTWQSARGDVLAGAPGDWRVSDDSGATRTVTDASFRATHRPVKGEVWERTALVRARPAAAGELVMTQEGRVHAGIGDWLVRDAAGNQWVVGEEHFRAGYTAAP